MEQSESGPPGRRPGQAFTPELVTALAQRYSLGDFRADALAGLTVAILALPLSMAIAIGAGTSPDKGLITTVIAGAIISAFGGSRFQVGGPAAAFIVIVGALIDEHGYGGMLTATLLAGLILIIAGALKLGTYIKYVPGPVILGFTSGIGIVIAIGQMRDLLGISAATPRDVIDKLPALWAARGEIRPEAVLLGLGTLAVILAFRRFAPRWPGLLFAVVAASSAAAILGLPVETIGTRFGGIPDSLPAPSLPDLSLATIRDILPSAFTLAFLIGVESLLSAVAADTMAGTRHRPNMEVVAQGAANMASSLFGGMPATGVIARTGTNIQAGARTPVSGLLHALFVLAFMLLAAPAAAYLALPCLAAVLLHVSWRLIAVSELRHYLTRAPADDRAVMLATLALTILVDLNAAIAVGVVMAALLFTHRMAETPGALTVRGAIETDESEDGAPRSLILDVPLPPEIRVFEFRGPLFFGAAARVDAAVSSLRPWPHVIILRMRDVPLIDATAIGALEDLAGRCRKAGCRIVISGLQQQPRQALHRFGFLREHDIVLASNSYVALEKAKAIAQRVPATAPKSAH